MSLWVHDGSRVFNGLAPPVWTALDLKAVAGGGSTSHPTAQTLALLKVENGSGFAHIAFRPKGSGYGTYTTSAGCHGCCKITPNNVTNDAALVLLPTDPSGEVEWRSGAANATEVWLVGYVEMSIVSLEVRSDSAMPAVWTTLDLTQDIAATPTGLSGEALCYLWVKRTGGGSNAHATRPEYPGYDNFLGSNVLGGCSQGTTGLVNEMEGILQKTNSSGEIEIICNAPVSNTEIILGSFEQTSFASGDIEVFPAGTPPLAWQSLDLSSYIGSQRALVVLQVHVENSGAGLLGVAVRPPGDPADYLPGFLTSAMGVACCALNADDRTLIVTEAIAGAVEWIASADTRDVDIRLAGVIPETSTTPVGGNTSPAGVVLSRDSRISFTISDTYGLDLSTLVITATPVASPSIVIYTGGAWQPGWSGLLAAESPIFGSHPTKLTVNITDFSDAFIQSSPRRYTMSAAITNILGQAL